MAEQIINAVGSQYGLVITPAGEALISGTVTAVISGGIHIGSVSANVDSIFIQSGANMTGSSWVYQKTDPWVVSGTSTVAGSIYTTGSQRIVNFGDLGSQRVVEGSVYNIPTTPTLVSSNPEFDLVSGANGEITSIVQYIGADSYTKTLTWEGGSVLINIGSWV